LLGRTITLDTTGPTVSASLGAPTNGIYYDVGARLALTWSASDATSGVVSLGAKVETQTISSSSSAAIDLDSLTAGAHTVTVTATDAAGNVTAISLVFTIRPTAKSILAAINDGFARGWMTAAEKTTLVNAINNVIGANGGSGNAKLRGFISQVQSATAVQLVPAFQTLLLKWANDLLPRI
jgi:cytochrome c